MSRALAGGAGVIGATTLGIFLEIFLFLLIELAEGSKERIENSLVVI